MLSQNVDRTIHTDTDKATENPFNSHQTRILFAPKGVYRSISKGVTISFQIDGGKKYINQQKKKRTFL